MPARLEAALKKAGRNVTVINHGVSGDTTAGGLQRIDWMLADKPDIVMVELGANDALRATDPADDRDATSTPSSPSSRRPASRCGWPACWRRATTGRSTPQQFDGLYKRLADKHGVPLYPFFLDGVAQDPALNQADGIHPNPKGVDVIVERILPFVTKNLDDFAASAHAPPVRRPARP